MVFQRGMRLSLVAGLLIALVGPVGAADKKAESELRWGLNYCKKAFAELDRFRTRENPSLTQTRSVVSKMEPHHQKFLDYLEKAKAVDPTVVDSETVWDRKTGETFGAFLGRCMTLEGEMAALSGKREALKAEADAAKADEAAGVAAAEEKRLALKDATDAIYGVCDGFEGFSGSSGFDERFATYEAHKKAALARLPSVKDESLTFGETTRTVAEWFAWCDEMMPRHAEKVRAAEADQSARDAAYTERRRAMNNELREKAQKLYQDLLAQVKGDRLRILKSKGFAPFWPRSGDIARAPVWKWEVNVTHQANKCVTYQFKGSALTRQSTALGACP